MRKCEKYLKSEQLTLEVVSILAHLYLRMRKYEEAEKYSKYLKECFPKVEGKRQGEAVSMK